MNTPAERLEMVVAAGDEYQRHCDADENGEEVDPDEYVFWMGAYHGLDSGWGSTLSTEERLIADYMHVVISGICDPERRSALSDGTDGDMARRLIIAIEAAGFALVDVRGDR